MSKSLLFLPIYYFSCNDLASKEGLYNPEKKSCLSPKQLFP